MSVPAVKLVSGRDVLQTLCSGPAASSRHKTKNIFSNIHIFMLAHHNHLNIIIENCTKRFFSSPFGLPLSLLARHYFILHSFTLKKWHVASCFQVMWPSHSKPWLSVLAHLSFYWIIARALDYVAIPDKFRRLFFFNSLLCRVIATEEMWGKWLSF